MAVMRLMRWLSLHLGRRVSRCILYPIAAYFVLFAPSAKRASKQFLNRALGREAWIADGFHHVLSFASVVHDRIYWLSDCHDLFDIQITGDDLLEQYQRTGRGVVFMGGHFGSFEALRVLGVRNGLDVRMLMYPDNARMVTQTLAAINPALADSVIALGRSDAVLRVRDHLTTGGCVGILADRSVADAQEGTDHVEFLGSPAPFPTGPFRLAALLRAPVVFMAGVYLGGNRYHLRFDAIADFQNVDAAERSQAMTNAQRRYVEILEAQCVDAPWNWFNFYDFWANDAP
ncbi:acyl-CoA synthetase [Ottowia sp. GY511]|uniref:Acyl-CoA synthetase n=1 Tax=Ottowia flava TaxID=2675430 RepID=A0ABW4KPH2_9BURK|nr:acyl-CoA synthetase [Ottowia sp. GY511]TXK29531.1 acyl-CoA synthetase [Ottowia sp. GY511]